MNARKAKILCLAIERVLVAEPKKPQHGDTPPDGLKLSGDDPCATERQAVEDEAEALAILQAAVVNSETQLLAKEALLLTCETTNE